jgi:hypothetical protein
MVKDPVVLLVCQVLCSYTLKSHDHVIDSAAMKNQYHQQQGSSNQDLF